MSGEPLVALWTWITFGAVAFILYKIAWKPILAALDAREARIRKSVEDADQARRELVGIEQTKEKMLSEAEDQTKQMIAKARDAASVAANHIEQRANEKVQIMYENAERDIEAMQAQAAATMRNQQVDMVISLTTRLVEENMDTEKNRALTDKLLAKL